MSDKELRARPLSDFPDADDDPYAGTGCNIVAEDHLGPIETDVVPDPRPGGNPENQYLADVCRNCGYVWATEFLLPERAEQYRRALAAKPHGWRGRP